MEETRDHTLRCKKAEELRSKCLRTIGIECESLQAHKGLHALLIRGLRAWFRGEDALTANGYDPDMTLQTFSQNAIGWANF